jgi:hypothetical protein
VKKRDGKKKILFSTPSAKWVPNRLDQKATDQKFLNNVSRK